MTGEAPNAAPRAASAADPVLIAGLLLAATVGAAALTVTTRHGVGLTSDSATYLEGARSLAAGQGFRTWAGAWIEYLAPLYPLLLAAVGRLAGGELAAARIVSIAGLASTAALAGWGAWRVGRRRWLATAAALVVALSPSMLNVHRYLMSEALNLALVTALLLLLARSLVRPGVRAAVAVGLVAGACWLTRYSGAAALGVAAVVALWSIFGRHRRVVGAALLASAAVLPLGWLAANLGRADQLAGRVATWHPPEPAVLLSGLRTIGWWWLPGAVGELLGSLAGAATLAVAFGLGWRAATREIDLDPTRDGAGDSASSLVAVSSLFLAAHLAIVVATMYLFDRGVAPTERILSPVFVPLLWVLSYGVVLLDQGPRRGARQGVVAKLAFAVVAAAIVARGMVWTAGARHDAAGYASRAWRESPTLAATMALPEGVRIYSNAPDALSLVARRLAYLLPQRVRINSGLPAPEYPAQLAELLEEVDRDAAVVYFTAASHRTALAPEAELRNLLAGTPLAETSDGWIGWRGAGELN